ncbi:antistasin-like [Paramacrobiotus metropolitanus]|uniref:antistasin-like n=1 Tax=Paramacrobiotus metropolitanus TaxID=2943436 RepID=UPI0024456D2C|nr:antistasin-like [Paramacrobiotus metropolitanus]
MNTIAMFAALVVIFLASQSDARDIVPRSLGNIVPRIGCIPIMCNLWCETGYEHDHHGCNMCSCRPVKTTPSPVTSHTCEPVYCRIFCPNGFRRDAYGCEECACNPVRPTCPPVMCLIACPNGFAQGENGCPRCACNNVPLRQQQRHCRKLQLTTCGDGNRRTWLHPT